MFLKFRESLNDMVAKVVHDNNFYNQTRFSVVIPLYNRERYIVRTLNSVLKQTRSPGEIVVVDDGSTDAGGQLVKSTFGNKVKLIEQQNRGVSAARNAGIKASGGDWVAFLDADDIWLPNHLEELSRQIISFPHAGMVASNSIQLNVNAPPPERSPPGRVKQIDYLVEASKCLTIVNSSSVAIRRDVFNSIGDFKSYKYGEDLEMWARVSLHYPVAFSDSVTSIYYRGTGGAMEKLNNKSDDKKKRKIKALPEVTPTIKMLCESGVSDNESSKIYISSIIKMMVKQDILSKDIARARMLRKLMPKKRGLGFSLTLLLFLPADLTVKIVNLRSFLRESQLL